MGRTKQYSSIYLHSGRERKFFSLTREIMHFLYLALSSFENSLSLSLSAHQTERGKEGDLCSGASFQVFWQLRLASAAAAAAAYFEAEHISCEIWFPHSSAVADEWMQNKCKEMKRESRAKSQLQQKVDRQKVALLRRRWWWPMVLFWVWKY